MKNPNTATEQPDKSVFVQIERQLLDYLSDQWPSAYADLIARFDAKAPACDARQGYDWMPEAALAYLQDQWPTARQMMKCRATKNPVIMTASGDALKETL